MKLNKIFTKVLLFGIVLGTMMFTLTSVLWDIYTKGMFCGVEPNLAILGTEMTTMAITAVFFFVYSANEINKDCKL